MKKKIIHLPLLAAAVLTVSAVSSQAAIAITGVSSTTISTYNSSVSSTDLINVGSSSLGTFTADPTSAASGFDINGAHDGAIGGSNADALFWNAISNPSLTYTFAGSATGYDITSIQSIYAFSDTARAFTSQKYTVQIATVGNATFTDLATVSYDRDSSSTKATMVTLTEDAGDNLLASGVTGIKFIFTGNAGGNRVGVIGEIDVFGTETAAIPEPSAALLGGLGLLTLLRRRR